MTLSFEKVTMWGAVDDVHQLTFCITFKNGNYATSMQSPAGLIKLGIFPDLGAAKDVCEAAATAIISAKKARANS